MNPTIDTILRKVDSLKLTQDFFFVMNKTIQLRYSNVYETDKKEFKNLGNAENDIFLEILNLMDSDELDNGIYSYYSIDKKVIHHIDYNPELFSDDAMELILYQTYGVTPFDAERKAQLEESLSQEKIKKTLVYACYLNLTDEIDLLLSKKISKGELNRDLKGIGTPLGLSIQENNTDDLSIVAFLLSSIISEIEFREDEIFSVVYSMVSAVDDSIMINEESSSTIPPCNIDANIYNPPQLLSNDYSMQTQRVCHTNPLKLSLRRKLPSSAPMITTELS